MNHAAKLSVVLPVRDGQQRIATEVPRVLEALTDITSREVEIVVVDDGSQDATAEILDDLRRTYPQVRVARHRRPLGMEAAGQTGLERATGELVFIQEEDTPLRMDDLVQLYRMGADESVVAARAQSQTREGNGPLLRRLKAWGAKSVEELQTEATREKVDVPIRGLQMVRRPHLQLLASRGGEQVKLKTQRIRTKSPQTGGTVGKSTVASEGVVDGDRDAWFASSMGV
jgi:glycosyltransferase involved in cell wall biosynthesis